MIYFIAGLLIGAFVATIRLETLRDAVHLLAWCIGVFAGVLAVNALVGS